MLFCFILILVPGRLYTISVTTSGGDGKTQLKASTTVDGTSLANLYLTAGTSTCDNDPYVPGYYGVGYGIISNLIGPTAATYSASFTPGTGQAQQYFVLWGYGGDTNNGANSGFYISKIIITEIVPGVTISPTILNFTCGNAISQTFTAGYVGPAPLNYHLESWSYAQWLVLQFRSCTSNKFLNNFVNFNHTYSTWLFKSNSQSDSSRRQLHGRRYPFIEYCDTFYEYYRYLRSFQYVQSTSGLLYIQFNLYWCYLQLVSFTVWKCKFLMHYLCRADFNKNSKRRKHHNSFCNHKWSLFCVAVKPLLKQ